jgi:hypothetical protein
MSEQNNPPAFPVVVPELWHHVETGMSLRDWFAGQALVAMGTWTPYAVVNGKMKAVSDPLEAHAVRAAYAFAQADAMLSERDRRASE